MTVSRSWRGAALFKAAARVSSRKDAHVLLGDKVRMVERVEDGFRLGCSGPDRYADGVDFVVRRRADLIERRQARREPLTFHCYCNVM